MTQYQYQVEVKRRGVWEVCPYFGKHGSFAGAEVAVTTVHGIDWEQDCRIVPVPAEDDADECDS